MNKESLEIMKEELLKLKENTQIDELDKMELILNLYNILDDYDNNMKILRKYGRNRKYGK